MERHYPPRREAPANTNHVFNDAGRRDPRAARDVAPGRLWVFPEHRSLAEVFAAERQP
jgi:hypothetical protein